MKSSVFLFCGLAALALGGCSPSNDTTNSADNSSATNTSVDNSATQNAAIIPSGSATPKANAVVLYSVWVPGSDDKLHQKPVSKAAIEAQKKFGDPTAALAEIVKMAPQYFPPQTQVLDFRDDGKTVSINLNRNFKQSDFWSQNGDLTLRLALYALVNSAADATDGTKSVVIKAEKIALKEGELGELSVEGGFDPDRTLEAKAGATPLNSTQLKAPSGAASTSTKPKSP